MRVEEGVYEQARGEVRRSRDGVTVGAYPDGLVYVEGRAAAILDGPDSHELLQLADLGRVVEKARVTAGCTTHAPASIGRCDVASELAFEDGQHGRRFLAALASIDVPWLKTGTEGGKRSGLETVYWRTVNGRSVQLRAYDKGVESGLAAPGELVRVERQARFRKAKEASVEQFSGRSLGELFVGRELAVMLERAPAVHAVGDVPAAIAELRDRAKRGEVRGQQAERLIGYLTLRGVGLPERTLQRRDAELRALGLAVAFGADSDDVPVRPLLAELVQALAA